MNEELIRRTALVVPSCDKFSDTWVPQFDLLFRFWPDCPFDVYLISNELAFEHPRVQTLRAGPDMDWSTTISRGLAQIDHQRMLFWIDDAFLSAPVNTREVVGVLALADAMQANFVRMRPDPGPALWLPSGFGVLAKGAMYRVSLFATLWDRQALGCVLCPGESAWEFETKGSVRADKLDRFYCIRSCPFEYEHGIERGTWLRPAVAHLERNGHRVDGARRRIMTRRAHVGLVYRQLKSAIFHLAPEAYRPGLLQTKRRVAGLVRSVFGRAGRGV